MTKDKEIDRRQPLADEEKEMMLAVLIRREEAFLMASTQLTPDRFNEYDVGLGLVWAIVCDYYEQYQELPGKDFVVVEINRRTEEDPTFLDDEDDVEKLEEFLAVAYETPTKDLKERVAMGYLRRFLDDHLVERARDILGFDDAYTPVDLPATLRVLTDEASAHQALEADAIELPFEEGWDRAEAMIKRWPTNVPFFDGYTNGGHAAKETYVLLAPYGVGKTTTMIMLSVRTAVRAYADWRKTKGKIPLGISYHVTYEEPKDSLRIRAICFQGQIHKDTLEEYLSTRNRRCFSTSRNLKPYERELFANKLSTGEPVSGEISRFFKAQETLNRNWRIIDMTGADEQNPGKGAGLVDELAAVIRQDQKIARQRKKPCCVAGAFTDYVGAAAERHIDFHGLKHEATLRHIINRWPLHMKQKIAIPFVCPVWSCHQLDTKSQSRTSGHVPSHSDSAEGKAIGENADFAFVYGTMTDENHCVMACSKHRRVEAKPPIILRLSGEFSRMVNAESHWVLDTVNKKIMNARERARLTDGEVQPAEDTEGNADPGRPTSPAGGQVVTQQQNIRRVRRVPQAAGRNEGV